MKMYKRLIFLVVFFMLTASKCKKDPVTNPVDQLPAATQTGANTFGCLVNGQVFLPAGSPLAGPRLFCTYQYLNNLYDTVYFFNLSATNIFNSTTSSSTTVKGLSIGTDSLEVKQGGIYSLQQTNIRGKASAGYSLIGTGLPLDNGYETNSVVGGQLTLKKFDLLTQIVSGTFWFNAVNKNGDTIKVTDGRFDVHFTR